MTGEPASSGVMTERARILTFLIADVRGWTLFTQMRGDEVAAKLAAKFAEVAREVVEGRDGQVLELRGDEAMCVFTSARQAIRAAVELQDRFYEETISDPELPLPVGIGLDAGEAVPVEGGYRGGALNLAARLCGQAKAGEILASRGVTHLAQRVDGVRYVDRGRVKLKNLSEPVELVGLVPEGVDPAERLRAALPPTGPASRRWRPKVVIAAAVALAVAVGAAIVVFPDDAEPTIAAGAVGLLSLSGDLEGTVDVGEFPRGLASGAGSLWVADQESGSLLQVDPSTFQVQARIPVGLGPTGVAIAGGFVWVANTDGRTVSVVDPEAQKVVQTIDVGNGPAGIVADGDRVWVTSSVDATVTEIDATEGTVSHTWPVHERPVAIAVGEGAVWVANASDASVSRVVSGAGETQRIPVGRGPAGIAFAFGSLWVANAEDGTVTTIDPATGSATTERVGGGADAIASAGDGIWVVSARDGTVARIDPATTQVTDTYEVGNEPRAVTGNESGLWIGVEASPAAHQGGTLQLVTEHRVSIDPHGSALGSKLAEILISAPVLATMYDGLVTYRKTGGATGTTVVPDLAVSLPTDAGLTYTFALRDGIRFSNGHVLTPQDVVASFERVLVGNKYGRLLLPELVGGSTCTPKDPQACDLSRGVVSDEDAGTVAFHLVRPAPDFLKILATPWFAIVPAGTPIRLQQPIPATGPYVIDDIGQDGSLALERNLIFHEWSADAQPDGFADRVEVMAGIDIHEQVPMIEQGRVDLGLDGVPADLVEELDRRASDQMVRSQFFAIGALALDTASPPFDNEDARRALAYALDRDELNRDAIETAALFAGKGVVSEELTVTCQILPPHSPAYAPYCPYTGSDTEPGTWASPDFSHAARLVQRSGTAGADVLIAMSPCLEAIAKQIKATLDDLGYHVELDIDGPPNCLFGGISRDADVSFVAWANDYPSAAPFMVPLLSCVEPKGSHPFLDFPVSTTVTGIGDSWNFTNFCGRELDRRLQRAVQLTDPHASARAFEALDHDFVDLATLIPFGTGTDVWLVSPRVRSIEISPLDGPVISQVRVE